MARRPSDIPKSDTRTSLLEAAEHVFAEKGFDAATLRTIAARARVNSALIQYHFGGKAALYEAVIDRRMAEARRAFDAATTLSDVATNMGMTREVVLLAIRSMLIEFTRLHRTFPAFFRIMQREEASGFRIAEKVAGKLMPLEPLGRLLLRAQESGVVRRDLNPKLAAALLLHTHWKCLSARRVFCRIAGLGDSDARATVDTLLDQTLMLFGAGMWQAEEKQ